MVTLTPGRHTRRVAQLTEAVKERSANGLSRVPRRSRRERSMAAQTGAALFPQVVWAHYQWERRLHRDGVADSALEHAYRAKLQEFEHQAGKLEQVYWSTKSASAVAMTMRHAGRPRADPLRLREHDDVVHFHRVTDWVTRDAPLVAELLHECDLLASRIEHVLRGTSERIAMRWVLGIAMHLLGFIERDSGPETAGRSEMNGTGRADEREFV